MTAKDQPTGKEIYDRVTSTLLETSPRYQESFEEADIHQHACFALAYLLASSHEYDSVEQQIKIWERVCHDEQKEFESAETSE